ncbi:hypothetical protein [Streptomyces sp. NPDC054794]
MTSTAVEGASRRFLSLIGGRGVYAVSPHGRWVPGGYYEDGTLMRRSRWITTGGVVECREALALPAEETRLILLRKLLAIDATAHVPVVLDPRADYGRAPLSSTHRDDDGVWHLNTGRDHLRWQGAPLAVVRGEGLTTDLTLKPGENHDLVLECSQAPLPHSPPALEHTIAPRDARRAHALLRGLTTHGGGMVAATTSLPERAEGPAKRPRRAVCTPTGTGSAAPTIPRSTAATHHRFRPGTRPPRWA